MYLNSLIGEYQFENERWCFIPNLPSILELKYFTEIIERNLDISGQTLINSIPDNFEELLIEFVRNNPEFPHSSLNFEKAILRKEGTNYRLSEFKQIRDLEFDFTKICNIYGGVRNDHAFILNSKIFGGINCAPASTLFTMLDKLSEFEAVYDKKFSIAAAMVESIYFLLLHPLKDSNGRAMRAFLGAKLHDIKGISSLPIFLGPLWNIYSIETSEWLFQLQMYGGWDVIIYRLSKLLSYYDKLSIEMIKNLKSKNKLT